MFYSLKETGMEQWLRGYSTCWKTKFSAPGLHKCQASAMHGTLFVSQWLGVETKDSQCELASQTSQIVNPGFK